MGEEGKKKGREGKGGEEKGRGRRRNEREERASHTAAALGLAKPRAGSAHDPLKMPIPMSVFGPHLIQGSFCSFMRHLNKFSRIVQFTRVSQTNYAS